MTLRSSGIRKALRVMLAGTLVLWPGVPGAQEVSIPAIKAAFLINFVKFAEWPEDSLSARTFTFCISGDRAVFDALQLGVKQRPQHSPVDVAYLTPEGSFQGCHLLYLGGVNGGEWRRALHLVGNAPVFTASDARGFAEGGGIAELTLEGSRMRFNINTAAAQRAHIALSAKLLNLATLVKERPHDGR